ncbi:MAG: DMT family transporter, partial [Clostridiales bacterium]
CFVSGLSSCVYVLLLERPRIQGLPVVLMTAVVNSFSSLSFWVYCAVAGQVEFALPGMAWLYLALLALFPTSLGVLCWTRGVRMIGAAKASIIGVFEPLEGVLIGCIFLAEGMNGLQLLGAVLIASAIVLINKAGQQENKCRGIAVKKSMKMV